MGTFLDICQAILLCAGSIIVAIGVVKFFGNKERGFGVLLFAMGIFCHVIANTLFI